jgi:hypothetical protein
MKKKIIFLFAFFKSLKRKESDPDPSVRGADSVIRIRTKMSRISNNDKYNTEIKTKKHRKMTEQVG